MSSSATAGGGSRVKVAVRLRPFSAAERASGETCCVRMRGNAVVVGNPLHHQAGEEAAFSFDHCYWSFDHENPTNPYATNADLWADLGGPVLRCALEGVNCCLFAYGATGSGKSYCIRGEGSDPGLLPLLCRSLCTEVLSAPDGPKYSIFASFYEIYNDRVMDLLTPCAEKPRPLKVIVLPAHDTFKARVIIKDLEKRPVRTVAEMSAVLLAGAERLSFNRTWLNDHASRSHSVFTLYIARQESGGRSRLSEINVIDLAGSEQVKLSGVSGESLRETCHINASLSTLARVIDAINAKSTAATTTTTTAATATVSSGTSETPSSTSESSTPSVPAVVPAVCSGSTPHVPYRDSKLTTLLSGSLGGSSRTFMVATVAPGARCVHETLRTLRFAEGVSRVVTQPRVNREVEEILAELKQRRGD
eukprot:RCo052525